MPAAPLPGEVAKFCSPLYMHKRILRAAAPKPPTVFTAKDNSKTAFHVVTQRPGFATTPYTVSRWYLKEKVHSSNRNRLEGLYECVLCASCTGSCPQYWWNRELFLGPAVLLQSYRWLIEPLDRDFDSRVKMFEHGPLVNFCHNIFNCSITCPKFLNPGMASKEIKRLSSPATLRVGPPLEDAKVASKY
ncbi:succinate dehydrogenase, putative [Trypanosoma equiperdum]|uniref:Succinate dehydrogenase, putative n=4 Tax=Trypanozoon TaxID=39700 RepID=Q38EW9_TRYB2|nr:succinate dehydrogenase, putative [Trypanosoma brucei gambiense DAL972]XP_826981.1 succinate dehydrogenase, putative [Trypanosoma brucei brucei TREU927]RHW70584.1 succinate dehydrogenase [Trypanosoma brucei equiperdum]SCU67972.1 succinate dehydrogenase, putative [Trypanosoma equiperdum]EAN76651.1 succinate dehydrogenase, putative [Trypanosoma brucei brucei TREU927]CBH14236.1 succinate dehydrogenase, putative [Trypanosoma brucei gambiense DAL972]|eukprot:XP_011776506.1 succinate dehydrogenase, putative [Trypanosoma brucei gambiense DAL972]